MAASKWLRLDLDWDYIVDASIKHGVAPLFYHGLLQVAQTIDLDRHVPEHVLQQLHALYRGNRSRNARLYRAIREIFTAFEQVGVQAMGLKDLQLTWAVYPDLGLRPMGDIDILIRWDDYAAAAMAMDGLGFVPLPDADIPFTRKYAWAHHFHRPTDNLWIDLQWNVLQLEWDVYGEGSFDFEIDRMWRGATPMDVDGCPVLVPSPEDMLFHLCLHLEGHRYAELILFYDIVELLRAYDGRLDWDRLIDMSRRYGVASSVAYVLDLTQRLFDASLPPHVLQDLEPAYFKAAIFEPLFGNLTNLHLSLDQIRLAVSPPAQALQRFESIVRRQAAQAMQVYKEIDALASAFARAGGGPVILDGAPSQRIFPDETLAPFEPIRAFVLDRDLSQMHRALAEGGFDARNALAYAKETPIVSRDPALAGQQLRLRMEVQIARDLTPRLLSRSDGRPSKKEIALQSIKGRLARRGKCPPTDQVLLTIVALSPEDLFLYLTARLGRRTQERLFGLVGLLEYFRGVGDTSLDGQAIARKAQQLGVADDVREGALIARAVLDRVPAAVLGQCGDAAPAPRLLEWARYDPESFGPYADFKRLFLFLLSLLSIDGMRTKGAYLLESLAGGRLFDLAREVVTGIVARRHRRQYTATDFAYWVEPAEEGDVNP